MVTTSSEVCVLKWALIQGYSKMVDLLDTSAVDLIGAVLASPILMPQIEVLCCGGVKGLATCLRCQRALLASELSSTILIPPLKWQWRRREGIGCVLIHLDILHKNSN